MKCLEKKPKERYAKLAVIFLYYTRSEYEKGDRFWKSLKLAPEKFTFFERLLVDFLETWSKGNWSKCLKFLEQADEKN